MITGPIGQGPQAPGPVHYPGPLEQLAKVFSQVPIVGGIAGGLLGNAARGLGV